jgi:hypothetical protein
MRYRKTKSLCRYAVFSQDSWTLPTVKSEVYIEMTANQAAVSLDTVWPYCTMRTKGCSTIVQLEFNHIRDELLVYLRN